MVNYEKKHITSSEVNELLPSEKIINTIKIPECNAKRAALWILIDRGEVVDGINMKRAFAIKDILDSEKVCVDMFFSKYGNLVPFKDNCSLEYLLTRIVAQLDNKELSTFFGY